MASATELERLVVRMIADVDDYVDELDRAERKTVEGSKKMERSLKGVGKAMVSMGRDIRAVGRDLTKYVTLPLAAAGAASVKAFADFDQAMTQSTAIMNVTADTTERMAETAMKLGTSGNTLQGPTRLAEAYFFLASAGLDAEQQMKALPTVASFATAGMFDMSRATDLLTDAQSALGLTTKDATKNMESMTRVSDVLVKANTLANATVEQFSTSLTSKAGAALKAFGKDVEEGVAVLAAYADQGVKAELSGNALDRVLRLMAKSSMDNAKAHKELGFSVFDSTGKMRNMADIIGNLEEVLDGMSTQQKVATLDMLGFEARVQQVILPLIGMSDKIREYEANLRNAGGTTQDVADKQLKSFSSQLTITWNMINGVAIGIGQKLAPAIGWMNDMVRDAIGWWNSLEQSTQNNILVIGGIAAAIGPFLIGLGSIIVVGGKIISIMGVATTAIKAMTLAATTSPIGIAALALAVGATLAIAVYRANGAIRDFNRELERSQELAGQWTTNIRTQFKDIAKEADELSGTAKIDFLSGEVERMENELSGARAQVKLQEKAVKELNTEWNRNVGSKVLKQAQTQLAEAKARVDEYRAGVDALKTQLNITNVEVAVQTDIDAAKAKTDGVEVGVTMGEGIVDGLTDAQMKVKEAGTDMIDSWITQSKTMGLSARETEIYKMSLEGLSDAQIKAAMKADKHLTELEKQNSMMKEGERITESVMTAQEKHAKRLEELQELLDEGAISQTTFDRAVARAEERLNELDGKKVQVEFQVAGVDAVEAGSKEAALALRQFRNLRPEEVAGGVPEAKDAKAEAIGKVIVEAQKERDDKRNAHQNRLEELLDGIKEQGEDQPTPIVIQEANL